MFDILTYTNTIQVAKNQVPAENAHFAQNSKELDFHGKIKTKKLGMEELIPVQEIQVDPCGNGQEQKKILRQKSHHTACILFEIPKRQAISTDDGLKSKKINQNKRKKYPMNRKRAEPRTATGMNGTLPH